MSFRWVYAQPDKEESVPKLMESLGVPDSIARLLALREVTSFEEARRFFRPDPEQLHDPFLMKDMEAAANRLSRAIRNRERVLIYGDYDVDGTSATAVLILFLKEFGLDVSFFIPHRFKDGYGISREGVEHAEAIGANLIVSVDCGITAVEEAKLARELGIDLVICDHHMAGEELPDACAVLDPKRRDCSYPFDGLTGAGVAYKLIRATSVRLGISTEPADRLLDLVAISIASDIVPVTDENRVLMRMGLELINSSPRPGIRSLLVRSKSNGAKVTGKTILFTIGPRINAAGRMGDATIAVELMVSRDPKQADACASQLEEINLKRRDIDSRTTGEAISKLEKEYDLDGLSSMVLYDPEWHLGVIGIVASRLVDAYYRPVIMLSEIEGKVKGSARSIHGFNIYEALRECEDLLEQFGGHEYAAGLTMEAHHVEEFRKRIDRIACRSLSESDFEPELTVDMQLDLEQVDLKFWKLLSQFEPFGPGNGCPVFVSRSVELEGDPAIVGNGHLKLRLRQNGSSVFEAIGFNMHDYMPMLRECAGRRMDVAYEIEENYWNRRRSLQLRLRDIHPEGSVAAVRL